LATGLPNLKGETHAIVVREVLSLDYNTMFNFRIASGANSDSRHDYRFNITSDLLYITMFTDTGTSETASAGDPGLAVGEELDFRHLWDLTDGIEAAGVTRLAYTSWDDGAQEIVNAESLPQSGGTSETGLTTRVQIGSASPTSYHLDGWVQLIEVFAEPRAV
jgi:hypothetical protein